MIPDNLTEERDFLFLMEIKEASSFQNQADLAAFLAVLPQSIRIYAVIPAGMNILKVYCITSSQTDYQSVTPLTGAKTEKFNTNNLE